MQREDMIRRSTLIACTVLALGSGTTSAGTMAEAFPAGVLRKLDGCQPEEITPGGTWSSFQTADYYRVADARKIFGIKRGRKDSMTYVCTTNRTQLSSIQASFPANHRTLNRLSKSLTETFGPPTASEPRGKGVLTTWQSEDGYAIRVMSPQLGYLLDNRPLTVEITHSADRRPAHGRPDSFVLPRDIPLDQRY